MGLTDSSQLLASSLLQSSGSPAGSGLGVSFFVAEEEVEEEESGEDDCCCWGKMSLPQME